MEDFNSVIFDEEDLENWDTSKLKASLSDLLNQDVNSNVDSKFYDIYESLPQVKFPDSQLDAKMNSVELSKNEFDNWGMSKLTATSDVSGT